MQGDTPLLEDPDLSYNDKERARTVRSSKNSSTGEGGAAQWAEKPTEAMEVVSEVDGGGSGGGGDGGVDGGGGCGGGLGGGCGSGGRVRAARAAWRGRLGGGSR